MNLNIKLKIEKKKKGTTRKIKTKDAKTTKIKTNDRY